MRYIDGMQTQPLAYKDIDWSNWKPTERATLLFTLQNNQVLLIHKKRGLGAGKINGPGGRIDPGETPMQCAVREVQEELMITPKNVKEAGKLYFQFVDGLAIEGFVFTATAYEGTPTETAEAIPAWIDKDKIPYEKMWADDRLWLPLLLEGRRFTGRFLFDKDAMLGYEVSTEGCT